MRLATLPLILLIAACSPAAHFDCSGEGTAEGEFIDANYGELIFRHAIVLPMTDDGHTVLFTDDATLLAAMRASRDPLVEGTLAAQALGKHMVGFQYDRYGDYKQRIVVGNQSGSGWSGADRGSIRIEADGCARGYAQLDGKDWGTFAVPLWRDPGDVSVEPGGTPPPTEIVPEAPLEATETSEADAELALWRLAWTRLHLPEPALALEALGLGPGPAAVLAGDARGLATLARMRQQCADATTALWDGSYGEVVGNSPTVDGVAFWATVRATADGPGARIANCYVMERNGQSLEQCWPLQQDCRYTKVWGG